MAPGVWPDDNARRQVEELVRKAASDATAARPGVTVHGEVFDGPPALVLEERSAEAGLLVLGSRGHGGFAGLLAGSTAVSVAAHAHCPVVVVRGAGPGRARPARGGRRGRLGVRRCWRSDFAVERAAQRDVPLRVLRAWTADGRGAVAPRRRGRSRPTGRRCEEPLARWRRRRSPR